MIPFVLPGPLQGIRSKMFYWRNVLYYRLLVDSKGYADNMVEFKFLRVVMACFLVKVIQKGNQEEKKRHLADYNLRKSNIAAAEKSFWEEELALHTGPDAKAAEASVYRQRMLDWEFRDNQSGYAFKMATMKFPFVASANQGEPALK